jgi:membrane-bound lytic murein transglycosylase D
MKKTILYYPVTLLLLTFAPQMKSQTSMDTLAMKLKADDSLYIERLTQIPAVIEMPYNETVRKFIDSYTGPLRSQISFMLGASNFYTPIFEEALDAYQLPLELKYLPVIESALNPSISSRAGACGLWQFMPATGRGYGLEINSLVDDRRDPIKSTWAAVRYLNYLYKRYTDWNLAIAAYNCGEGTIDKAIHRAGGKTDYWEIYSFLPRETRDYVPRFIAANYAMTYYCNHDIIASESKLPLNTDTVMVSKDLHFEQIAAICDIDIEAVKSLNPQYIRNTIPGNNKPYTLRLPMDKINTFIDRQDTIYAYRADELLKKRTVVIAKTSVAANKKGTQATGNVLYHKIKSGESLSTIASKYRVGVSQLKKWNNLKGDQIAAGKQLKINR